MISRKYYTLILAAPVLVCGLGTAPAMAQKGLARGHLYSTAAVNKLCSTAQQIVASTDLEVNNAIYSEWNGFVQGDATPYSIVPVPPFPNYAPAEQPDTPLTTAQHVIYGFYGGSDRDYPQVVSCKMKSADYLVDSNLDPQAEEQPCSAINEYYASKVIGSLTNPELSSVVIEPDDELVIGEQIYLDADSETSRGSQWTAGFPGQPYPVLYREYEGGELHVKSRALYVDANTDTIDTCNAIPALQQLSFCTPRKWGVSYCHIPAPEYIRAALTGKVDVPIIPGGP
jgi:hypothetical protein